jgi:integrase
VGAIDLRFVDAQCGRDGRIRYHYFRRNGRRWRLPGLPGSPEFLDEYNRLLQATDPVKPALQQAYRADSIGALIDDYFASPEFRGTKPNTQRLYRIVLEPLGKRIGHTAVRHIERRHIKALRDERAETPGAANTTVKVVSALLKYAVDNDWIAHNPAARVKIFKLGEHRAWTDDECLRFEARWAPGTMQRRCYVLAKSTGQRAGDLAKMTRAHRKDGCSFVKQEKTGKELYIPELQELAAELARGEQGHMSLLTKPDGSGFDGKALSGWFAGAIDAAGLPEDCVLHGLRKLTAKMLAEAGNSPHLIGAITGHSPQSPEITRYTRAADQRLMATAAILTLEPNVNGTPSAKRTPLATAKQSKRP